MMVALRSAAKRLLYHSGAAAAWHAWRNGGALTVVMFHRVLPDDSPRWRHADPLYTVSETGFRCCLRLFRRHYSIVSADAVVAALAGAAELPRRPLLVTFDDGWADNHDHALPVLREEGVPALIFIVPDALADPVGEWWQETVILAYRQGRCGEIWERFGLTPAGQRGAGDVLALLAALERLPRSERDAAVARLTLPERRGRDMLTPAQLGRLVSEGVAIGVHGASHVPLPMLENQRAELDRARRDTAALTGTSPPATMSFPHGRYDGESVRAARANGFAAIFTSEEVLNPLDAGRPAGDLLGRIRIGQDLLRDGEERIGPEKLAFWLFDRPRRVLQAN